MPQAGFIPAEEVQFFSGVPAEQGEPVPWGAARQFYDLERLWKDAAEVDLSGILKPN